MDPKTTLAVPVRAEEFSLEDPAAPAVGKWYWVKDKAELPEDDEGRDEEYKTVGVETERWLGCIVHIGSNYVSVRGLGIRTYKHIRVHADEFWERCEHVPHSELLIEGEVTQRKQKVIALMQEVREITARLAISGGSLALSGGGTETQAVAMTIRSDKPVEEYKTALVLAQKETLPELFKKIKHENALMSIWMSAPLIPLEAEASSLEPAISKIKDRLFSVELYAGLAEEIQQIKEGEPAPFAEKIHIFQRRAYMDEECLAEYEAGGMEFANLAGFNKWLCRPRNLERLMPFQRCILAFKVRRYKKEREWDGSLAAYFNIMELQQRDAWTFLYIRNGEQVFLLSTEIEFDEQLFPDMRHEELTGPQYAAKSGGGYDIIGENELRAMREADRVAKKEYEQKLKEHDEWEEKYKVDKTLPYVSYPSSPSRASYDYHPFDRSSVWYDDICKSIADDMARHNRLVLVLQGLLDRSPVLHPHPPWSLWNQDSFAVAVTLIYDNVRALVAGEKPDFEAYRIELAAQIKVGSVMLGQQDEWLAKMKEEHEEWDHSGRRRHYYHFDENKNPGPGEFAHVVKISNDGKYCTFQWNKKRRAKYGEENGEVGCRFVTETEKLFNVSAYKPGDFRKFFADPRTRAEYLCWAPLLLEAEEFHAGNRKVAAVKPIPPRVPRRPGGSWEYQQRKRLKEIIGKAVRNRYVISTKGGHNYKVGMLWRVTFGRGDRFTIVGITKDGRRVPCEKDAEGYESRRSVSQMRMHDLEVDLSIPAEPKDPPEEEKPKKQGFSVLGTEDEGPAPAPTPEPVPLTPELEPAPTELEELEEWMT